MSPMESHRNALQNTGIAIAIGCPSCAGIAIAIGCQGTRNFGPVREDILASEGLWHANIT